MDVRRQRGSSHERLGYWGSSPWMSQMWVFPSIGAFPTRRLLPQFGQTGRFCSWRNFARTAMTMAAIVAGARNVILRVLSLPFVRSGTGSRLYGFFGFRQR